MLACGIILHFFIKYLRVLKSKTRYGYFKKIEKKISALLKKNVNQFDKEDYHRLRVEIKKLNALLESVKFYSNGFKEKKYTKVLKRPFKQAGKIRELQLAQAALKQYSEYHLEHYLNDLQSRISKEEEKLSSLLNKRLRKKVKKAFAEIVPFLKKKKQRKNISEAAFMAKQGRIIKEIICQKSSHA